MAFLSQFCGKQRGIQRFGMRCYINALFILLAPALAHYLDTDAAAAWHVAGKKKGKSKQNLSSFECVLRRDFEILKRGMPLIDFSNACNFLAENHGHTEAEQGDSADVVNSILKEAPGFGEFLRGNDSSELLESRCTVCSEPSVCRREGPGSFLVAKVKKPSSLQEAMDEYFLPSSVEPGSLAECSHCQSRTTRRQLRVLAVAPTYIILLIDRGDSAKMVEVEVRVSPLYPLPSPLASP
jgi:hypothetical protein